MFGLGECFLFSRHLLPDRRLIPILRNPNATFISKSFLKLWMISLALRSSTRRFRPDLLQPMTKLTMPMNKIGTTIMITPALTSNYSNASCCWSCLVLVRDVSLHVHIRIEIQFMLGWVRQKKNGSFVDLYSVLRVEFVEFVELLMFTLLS